MKRCGIYDVLVEYHDSEYTVTSLSNAVGDEKMNQPVNVVQLPSREGVTVGCRNPRTHLIESSLIS